MPCGGMVVKSASIKEVKLAGGFEFAVLAVPGFQ